MSRLILRARAGWHGRVRNRRLPGEMVEALVVSAMVIGIDESRDLGFKVLFEEEVFQQDAVLQRLVPALDIALRLRMDRKSHTFKN